MKTRRKNSQDTEVAINRLIDLLLKDSIFSIIVAISLTCGLALLTYYGRAFTGDTSGESIVHKMAPIYCAAIIVVALCVIEICGSIRLKKIDYMPSTKSKRAKSPISHYRNWSNYSIYESYAIIVIVAIAAYAFFDFHIDRAALGILVATVLYEIAKILYIKDE